MKNLQFKKLSLISDQEKIGIQFEFGKRFNLIIGKTNSVGKSTIVKNIFWCFGCEVKFDDKWKDISCKAVIEFSIENKNYFLARHGDMFWFSESL